MVDHLMYKTFVRSVLFALSRKDPEIAHRWAIDALASLQRHPTILQVLEHMTVVKDPALEQEFFGLCFPRPVGLAGGFDKNAEVTLAWPALGFGFAEIGTVTQHAQEGSPRPRIFRLPKDKGLINRMGFNNEGVVAVAARLFSFYYRRKIKIPLLGSVGKSKITPLEEAAQDYCYTVERIYPWVDGIVINVSSPNTPDLRKLQGKEELSTLLGAIKNVIASLAQKCQEKPKPLLVKIAPDLTWGAIDDVLQVCADQGIDGLIGVNTTLSRKGLRTISNESGGLSGEPLAVMARKIIRYVRSHMGNNFFLIGVGGIFCDRDAYAMLQVGANLIQVYTGLIYQGPLLPRNINQGLAFLMERDGIKHISELRQSWGGNVRQLSA